jgi:flagellar assembly factor FliW
MEAATQKPVLSTFQSRPQTVIRFEDGLYGFESVKEYVLFQEDDTQTIWSLQAVHGSYPSFIVIDPFLVRKDYRPRLSAEDLRLLGGPAEEELCFLAIAVLKKHLKDSVINLKSPIVINEKTKTGRQVILEENDYPVRCRLFPGLK